MASEEQGRPRLESLPAVVTNPAPRGTALRGRGLSANAWMIIFTDLIALLLAFFVLLYSMSQVEKTRWQNLVDSLAQDFNSVTKANTSKRAVELHLDDREIVPGVDLDYLAPVLREQIAGHPVLARSVLQQRSDRLVISLPDDLVYRANSVDLAPDAEAVVFAMSGVLRNLSNTVEVEVFSDGTEPAEGFRSDWNLTLGRAALMASMLAEAGYEGPIMARGYGSSRHAQAARDVMAEGFPLFANRIDIIVHEWARGGQ